MANDPDSFIRGIQMLIERIQYLADKDLISQRSLEAWNNIIEVLTNAHNEKEAYIEDLEKRNADLIKKIIIAEDHHQEHITRLEAICLIHGIYDINRHLAKSTNYLIQEAKRNDLEEAWQMPDKLIDHYNNLLNKIHE